MDSKKEAARTIAPAEQSARVTQPRALVLLALIFLVYFGSLFIAACGFPSAYDWRERVISNLLSPRDNPDFYLIPSIGIAIGGALMFPVFSYLTERLRFNSPRLARIAWWCLSSGAALLMLASTVVPQHVRPVLGLRRLHEIFAHSSAVFFGIGMIAACAAVCGERRGFHRALAPAWIFLTAGPVVTLGLSKALLMACWYWPVWGPPVRRVMHQTVLWRLGFWEWLGTVAIYLFLCTGVVLLPEASPARPAR